MISFVLGLVLGAGPAAAPAGEVVPWTPAGVSSPMFESHAAFDPRNGDLYFVRSTTDFRGWRILVSRCGAQGWSPPVDAPFAGDGVEADPVFSADGRSLYFISTRTTDGIRRKDLDIWRVDRPGGPWGDPVRLPEPINSTAAEWFPRPSADGWLYFGSSRPGGHGSTDIWRARQDRPGNWQAENLGPEVNTGGDEYEPLPSPDGRSLVVMADGALYRTEWTGRGWTPRAKLGPQVNANGSEIGALFSPSGRSLLFARDAGAGRSGEFFVWRREPEAWPKACPVVGANH